MSRTESELRDRIRELEDQLSRHREQEEKYRNLVKETEMAFLVVDVNGTVLEANDTYVQLTGRGGMDKVLGHNVKEWTAEPERTANALAVSRCYENGHIRDFQVNYSMPDGTLRPVEINGSVMDYREPGRIHAFVREVAGRDATTAALMASLEEKEELLREVHHRVKNNLQVITSLLSLQSGYVADARARDLFNESLNRIGSMALVHDEIYRHKDFTRLEMAHYFERLVSKLRNSLARGMPVICQTSGGPALLPVSLAVPCGLLVNELVTNCIQHAFPDGREGLVRVEIGVDNDDVTLTVLDNGVGLPENFDPMKADTLGMRLVTSLASQIHADMSMTGDGGTTVRLVFPKNS